MKKNIERFFNKAHNVITARLNILKGMNFIRLIFLYLDFLFLFITYRSFS